MIISICWMFTVHGSGANTLLNYKKIFCFIIFIILVNFDTSIGMFTRLFVS